MRKKKTFEIMALSMLMGYAMAGEEGAKLFGVLGFMAEELK